MMHVDKVRASLRSIRDLMIGKLWFVHTFNLILCVIRGLNLSISAVYLLFYDK